jgi:hypothetical protein
MQRDESEGSHAACLPGWLRPTWPAAWLARMRATGRGRNANQTSESTLLSASLQTAVLLATAEGDAAGALHTREMSDTAGSRTEAQILEAFIADDAVRQLHSQDIEQYRQLTGIEHYESVYNALEAASWDVAVAVCAFWDSLAAPASPLQPATHKAGACQHTSSYVSIRQLLRKCGALSSSSCACLLCKPTLLCIFRSRSYSTCEIRHNIARIVFIRPVVQRTSHF